MTGRLYDLRRWRRESRTFLRQNPLCVMCKALGKTTLAVLVDHIVPHRDDPELFWDSENNWRGLCASCHSGAKQEQENTGRIRGCDVHGIPLDPAHLWNRKG